MVVKKWEGCNDSILFSHRVPVLFLSPNAVPRDPGTLAVFVAPPATTLLVPPPSLVPLSKIGTLFEFRQAALEKSPSVSPLFLVPNSKKFCSKSAVPKLEILVFLSVQQLEISRPEFLPTSACKIDKAFSIESSFSAEQKTSSADSSLL